MRRCRSTCGVAIWIVLVVAFAALSYRCIEFGHIRNWRPLFLLGDPAVMNIDREQTLGRRAISDLDVSAQVSGAG